MTTAAELAARTACADLTRKLDSALQRIETLEGCKFRLNGLIVARDHEIAKLYAENARLQAELDAAMAGKRELPY